MNQKKRCQERHEGEEDGRPRGALGLVGCDGSHEETRSVVVRDSFRCSRTWRDKGLWRSCLQSVTVAMSVAPSAETVWSHLRVVRPIVSPLVVLGARSCLRLRSDGSDARSELGDYYLSEVISGGRFAG